MAEPMIQIKKPDGTFAKVTLSEFKKIQAEKKQALAPAAQKSAQPSSGSAPKPSASPVVNPTAGQVMSKSTIHIKTDSKQPKREMAQPKKLTRDDARSPLEEKMPTKHQAPLTSPKREKQVEEVVRSIGFGVAPDLQGRLKSLILARLKDIKTEDEIKETLSRPIKNGGLGLAEPQVEKVVKSCRNVMDIDHAGGKEVHSAVPVLKGKPGNMALMVEPPELPMVIPVRNTTATKNSTPSLTVKKPAGNDVISKLITESMASEPVFKISDKPALKQTMQDVSAPAETEMGPVEEFKSVTIEEFRRLSSKPAEAAQRLRQKMSNLQDESFVWYLDGINAYHHSPLYTEYMSAVCESLASRKTLAHVLSIKNSIKLTEVLALIEMEEDL